MCLWVSKAPFILFKYHCTADSKKKMLISLAIFPLWIEGLAESNEIHIFSVGIIVDKIRAIQSVKKMNLPNKIARRMTSRDDHRSAHAQGIVLRERGR